MELIANLSGKVRHAKFDGRDFLVAPLTMLVPGVLNGSQGPILYQPADIQASTDAWNQLPIVLNHPSRGSARSPSYLDQFELGRIFNSSFDNKLKAEGWFDKQKCDRIDHRIISTIKSGGKLELSTGLALEIERTTGVHNGSIYYTGIARNYRPDHLALLLETVGACSIHDGCGVNNAGV